MSDTVNYLVDLWVRSDVVFALSLLLVLNLLAVIFIIAEAYAGRRRERRMAHARQQYLHDLSMQQARAHAEAIRLEEATKAAEWSRIMGVVSSV